MAPAQFLLLYYIPIFCSLLPTHVYVFPCSSPPYLCHLGMCSLPMAIFLFLHLLGNVQTKLFFVLPIRRQICVCFFKSCLQGFHLKFFNQEMKYFIESKRAKKNLFEIFSLFFQKPLSGWFPKLLGVGLKGQISIKHLRSKWTSVGQRNSEETKLFLKIRSLFPQSNLRFLCQAKSFC